MIIRMEQKEINSTQWLFVWDPSTDLYSLFILDSSEYARYSYLFFSAPICSACICHSYGILSTDVFHSVFLSYVFYCLNNLRSKRFCVV